MVLYDKSFIFIQKLKDYCLNLNEMKRKLTNNDIITTAFAHFRYDDNMMVE